MQWRCKRPWFDPWAGDFLWREWHPSVLLPLHPMDSRSMVKALLGPQRVGHDSSDSALLLLLSQFIVGNTEFREIKYLPRITQIICNRWVFFLSSRSMIEVGKGRDNSLFLHIKHSVNLFYFFRNINYSLKIICSFTCLWIFCLYYWDVSSMSSWIYTFLVSNSFCYIPYYLDYCLTHCRYSANINLNESLVLHCRVFTF